MQTRKKIKKRNGPEIGNGMSSLPAKTPRKAVTPELVERRARELAIIAGRNLDEITEQDRRQARLELLGPASSSPGQKPGGLPGESVEDSTGSGAG